MFQEFGFAGIFEADQGPRSRCNRSVRLQSTWNFKMGIFNFKILNFRAESIKQE
jgi:hypothetical protein